MRDKKVPIVILASGRGSNFEAISTAVVKGELSAEILAVISDRKDAPVLEKASILDIPALFVPPKALLEVLVEKEPHFLVLAGYKRILSKTVIDAFDSGRGYSRIVNIHPSLLPAFPGLGSYQKAFDYGCEVTGVTVHLVSEGVDEGPVCAQKSFEIDRCKTAEEVEALGLKVEHELYPKTLSWVLPEKFEWVSRGDRRVCIRTN
jgi:phosphoribosylglycinamide formyltransferase 1